MTVSSSTNRVSYSGNGSTTVFPYTYKIFDEDDLTVILRAANGTETVKTITSDYTVSGVGNAGGGNVTMLTAPASGETLVILREQDLVQELDIVPNDPFPADSLEAALDKLTFMVQQHEETLDRTIKASRTNTISGAEFTISAANRANKLLSFDSSGDLNITQELGTYRGDWAASTAYAQRDIVKDGGNDNLYFCNTAHTSSGSLPISSNADIAKWDLLLDVAAFSSLYDQFDDRYLGAKSSDPATDNDGNTLLDGALYWNTTDNRLKVYDLGNTAWKFTAPSPTEQANIDALAPIAAEVAAVGAIDTDVTAVAGITANVTTVAGIAPNVTTVAGISADVTAVAADATDIGTVATGIADVSTVAGIAGNVTTVAGISGNVTTVAGISANVTTVAGVSADVTTVAGVSADVSTVAGISANVTTVAGISADVTTVAANVAGVTSFAEKYRVGATDPTTSLDTGDLFYNTSSNLLKVYNGSVWETGVTPGSGFLSASNNLSDVADAGVSRTNLGVAVGTDVLAYDANLQGFVDAFTLPTTDGTAGQVLSTDGAGNLTLADAGGGGGLFTSTAHEALTAGDPVYMRNDNKVAKTFGNVVTDSGVNAGINFGTSFNSRAIWDSGSSRFILVAAATNFSNNFYAQAFTVSNGVVTAGTQTLVYTTGNTSGLLVEGLVDTGDGIVAILRDREAVVLARITGTGTSITVGTTTVVETSSTFQYRVAYALNAAKDTLFVVAQDATTADTFAYLVSISGGTLTVGSGVQINSHSDAFGAYHDSTTDTFTVIGTSETVVTSMRSTTYTYTYSGTTLTAIASNQAVEDFDFGTAASTVYLRQYYGNFVEIDGINYALKYNENVGSNFASTDLVGFANGSPNPGASYLPKIVTRVSLGVTRSASVTGALTHREITYSPNLKQLVIIQANNNDSRGVDLYTIFDMTVAHNPVKSKTYTFPQSLSFVDDTCAAINPTGNNKDNLIFEWDGTNTNVYTWDVPTDVNCIGIAQGTVSASASVDVAITGGISSVHSGLTAGLPYFASGGTISQTSGGRQVGYAISATDIVMTGA